MKVWILLCCIALGAAQNVLDCNFETNREFCAWNNDYSGNWKLDWKMRSLTQNGLLADNGQSDVNGACLETRSIVKDGTFKIKDYASKLIIKDISDYTNLKCVGFQYIIVGNGYANTNEGRNPVYKNRGFAKLTLMRQEMGSCESTYDKNGRPAVICGNIPTWESGATIYNQWSKVYVTLNKTAGDFKLILEGSIPSGNTKAKICVDNITSSADPCPKPVVVKKQTGPSYNSWVNLYGIVFAAALALGLTIPIAVFFVCMFDRKRRHGKKNNRIIRHADELDMPEGMMTHGGNSYDTGNSHNVSYNSGMMGTGQMMGTGSSQQQLVGVGNPRLMGRTMSSPSTGGMNGQGGNYTMGKRAGPGGMAQRSASGGQMGAAMTMARQTQMDSGWMMSSQHGDLMENDEYTIDPDYTTHRQMSVPANGYIPANGQPGNIATSRPPIPPPQPQQQQQMIAATTTGGMQQTAVNIVNSMAPGNAGNTNNPFGTPVAASSGNVASAADTRSVTTGSHANFQLEDGNGNMNRPGPGLPFYPPRYEEAIGFNQQGQPQAMEEKPPLLPPRVPDGAGSSSGVGLSGSSSNLLAGGQSSQNPLPPAPPPLPISGHPNQQVAPAQPASQLPGGRFEMPPPAP